MYAQETQDSQELMSPIKSGHDDDSSGDEDTNMTDHQGTLYGEEEELIGMQDGIEDASS